MILFLGGNECRKLAVALELIKHYQTNIGLEHERSREVEIEDNTFSALRSGPIQLQNFMIIEY
jgi:hypothetical protein